MTKPEVIRFPADAYRFARNWVEVAREAERYGETLTENWPDIAELKRCQRQIERRGSPP